MRHVLLIGSLNSLLTCVYAQDVDKLVQHNFSISTGYIGGFEKLSDDNDKLNGFFIKGAIHINPSVSFYTEYNKQKMSILKFNEVGTGIQYKFYDSQKINGSIGTGVGYMWLEQTLHDPHTALTADLKLKYITMPLFIESELKLSKNLSYFSNLSYEWLLNYDSKVCLAVMGIQTMCESINEDSEGLVYKLGIRYSF